MPIHLIAKLAEQRDQRDRLVEVRRSRNRSARGAA